MNDHGPSLNPVFATLRALAERRPPTAKCELCGAPLAEEHPHLVEPPTRRLLCACDACALLFAHDVTQKYRRVPRDVLALDGFSLSDAQWDSLLVPINMAFFFRSSVQGRVVAMYPSPAGATESLLELSAWQEIAAASPLLVNMHEDVEALLVNRLRRRGESEEAEGATDQYYLAPIDECYKLVGLLRANWRGLSGGTELWEAMAKFFAELKAKARHVPAVPRAAAGSPQIAEEPACTK